VNKKTNETRNKWSHGPEQVDTQARYFYTFKACDSQCVLAQNIQEFKSMLFYHQCFTPNLECCF
jgi:hypothetical protein